MKVDLDLPREIFVKDYHQFKYLESILQQLNSNIKVREICLDPDSKYYVGLIYIDNSDFEKIKKEWDSEDS